jgi:hypothetical protein
MSAFILRKQCAIATHLISFGIEHSTTVREAICRCIQYVLLPSSRRHLPTDFNPPVVALETLQAPYNAIITTEHSVCVPVDLELCEGYGSSLIRMKNPTLPNEGTTDDISAMSLSDSKFPRLIESNHHEKCIAVTGRRMGHLEFFPVISFFEDSFALNAELSFAWMY